MAAGELFAPPSNALNPPQIGGGGGSSSSGVTSVGAADTSIVVAGSASAPTIATNTLDVIAADHPPAANWSNNSKKITNLANGTAASDAAAFGQIPTLAFVQIYDSTAGASVANFDITSISQAYNHLRLITELRDDSANATGNLPGIRFNNDTAGNYDSQYMRVTGATVSGGNGAAQSSGWFGTQVGGGAVANTFGTSEIVIADYTNTARWKTYKHEGGGAWAASAGTLAHHVGTATWRSTAAISRITVIPLQGSNFVAGSRVTLYGLL